VPLRHVTIHGHEVGYRMAGEGPVVLLIHGMAGSSKTWRDVLPLLARRYTVVAPDLLGHGESAKPMGDYSLGAHASGLRDLLIALDIPRATIVGQSLGGGVAMQLAYQYPDLCERLALVGSGGLGREVSVILRLLALPGAEYAMPVLFPPFVRPACRRSRCPGRAAAPGVSARRTRPGSAFAPRPASGGPPRR
jgi:pimeloyl-ACP methyl ester carboxylesterase